MSSTSGRRLRERSSDGTSRRGFDGSAALRGAGFDGLGFAAALARAGLAFARTTGFLAAFFGAFFRALAADVFRDEATRRRPR